MYVHKRKLFIGMIRREFKLFYCLNKDYTILFEQISVLLFNSEVIGKIMFLCI